MNPQEPMGTTLTIQQNAEEAIVGQVQDDCHLLLLVRSYVVAGQESSCIATLHCQLCKDDDFHLIYIRIHMCMR